jgi:hypothetical protein
LLLVLDVVIDDVVCITQLERSKQVAYPRKEWRSEGGTVRTWLEAKQNQAVPAVVDASPFMRMHTRSLKLQLWHVCAVCRS